MSDFPTDDLRVKATERYSFGWTDVRAVTNRMKWPYDWYAQYKDERRAALKQLGLILVDLEK